MRLIKLRKFTKNQVKIKRKRLLPFYRYYITNKIVVVFVTVLVLIFLLSFYYDNRHSQNPANSGGILILMFFSIVVLFAIWLLGVDIRNSFFMKSMKPKKSLYDFLLSNNKYDCVSKGYISSGDEFNYAINSRYFCDNKNGEIVQIIKNNNYYDIILLNYVKVLNKSRSVRNRRYAYCKRLNVSIRIPYNNARIILSKQQYDTLTKISKLNSENTIVTKYSCLPLATFDPSAKQMAEWFLTDRIQEIIANLAIQVKDLNLYLDKGKLEILLNWRYIKSRERKHNFYPDLQYSIDQIIETLEQIAEEMRKEGLIEKEYDF